MNDQKNENRDQRKGNFINGGEFNAPVIGYQVNHAAKGRTTFLGFNSAILGILASLIAILTFFGISNFSKLSSYFNEKPVNQFEGVWAAEDGYQFSFSKGAVYNQAGISYGNYVVIDQNRVRINTNTIDSHSTMICSVSKDQNDIWMDCERGTRLRFVRK